MARVRHKALIRVEEQTPERHQAALVERKPQLILRRDRPDRREGEEVRLDRQNIIVAEQGVRGVRECRVKMLPVLAHAEMHRGAEVVIAPVADAGLLVGGDVGRIELAQSTEVKFSATGERVMARRSVAADAIAGTYQILAPLAQLRGYGDLRFMRNALTESAPGDERSHSNHAQRCPSPPFHAVLPLLQQDLIFGQIVVPSMAGVSQPAASPVSPAKGADH